MQHSIAGQKSFSNQVKVLLVFLLSLGFGVLVPALAVPWTLILLAYGLYSKRYEKGSLRWLVGRAASAAALALAVFIIVYFIFFHTVSGVTG